MKFKNISKKNFWRGNSKYFDTYWNLSLRWSVNVFRCFESWWKSNQQDIKCLIDNKEGEHTQRDRVAVALYIKKILLRYLADFFSEPFFKKCLICSARLSPCGGGGKFLWEAQRLFWFSDVFQSCDPHSLYGFSIDFQFKMWWISCRFVKKPLRKWVISKFQDQKFSSKTPLGNW